MAYSYNDYGGYVDESKNTPGYVFMSGFGVISWSPRKKPIVALSIIKVEFIATTQCVCVRAREGIWM